jgi:thioredoxin reductase
LEGKDGKLEAIVFENSEILHRKALFFTLGQHQQGNLPSKLGCAMTQKKAVRTGEHEETQIPGLYIAGDASESVQFPVVAAAEGAQAAFSIHQELLKEDLK